MGVDGDEVGGFFVKGKLLVGLRQVQLREFPTSCLGCEQVVRLR